MYVKLRETFARMGKVRGTLLSGLKGTSIPIYSNKIDITEP